MDGLFCALITGPAWVTPSEYLPLLWSGPLPDELVTFKVAYVSATTGLLTRHWNSILTDFDRGALHQPLIGADNTIAGRAWAQGFMRGVNYVQVGWNELFQDETSSQLYRIPRLARQTDPPSGRCVQPGTASSETLPWLAPAVIYAYHHFHERRLSDREMIDLTADG